MSARQSEDGLGLGGMLPDPAVLERMLSAAGLRGTVNGGPSMETASAAGNPNNHQPQTQTQNQTSFAAALESIVREEQEAAAAAEAAAANAALLRAASEQQQQQQLRGGGGGGGAAAPYLPLFKACRVCRVEQPIDNFYRVVTSKDGRDARCRACDARQCAERRRRRRERQEREGNGGSGGGGGEEGEEGDGGGEEQQQLPAEKLCRRCAASKPASSFYRNRASGDGLCDLCKPCFNGAAEARKSV